MAGLAASRLPIWAFTDLVPWLTTSVTCHGLLRVRDQCPVSYLHVRWDVFT